MSALFSVYENEGKPPDSFQRGRGLWGWWDEEEEEEEGLLKSERRGCATIA